MPLFFFLLLRSARTAITSGKPTERSRAIAVLYRYYDPSVWMVHRSHPRGGPLSGGTDVDVRGFRFHDLGDARCRFGVLNSEMNATITSEGQMVCVSPPHWNQQPVAQHVDLEITLNAAPLALLDPPAGGGAAGANATAALAPWGSGLAESLRCARDPRCCSSRGRRG